MMKIEFENVTLDIPNSWEDVKLGDYEKWYSLNPESKIEYVQYVADICNIDSKTLIGYPIQVFNEICEALSFIDKSDLKPIDSVIIDGVKFCIPFHDKITLAEWVDVDSILNSESQNKVSEVLSVFCRPIGEVYNPDILEDRKRIFSNLKCDKALPLLAFFLYKESIYTQILNHYSKEIKELDQFLRDTEISVQNGVGTKRLPIWQRIKYIYLMRSLKKQLSKFSDFSYTK